AFVRVCLGALFLVFFVLIPRPRISTLFPYTTLFRSMEREFRGVVAGGYIARAADAMKKATSRAYWSAILRGPLEALLAPIVIARSEEHTSELQSLTNLVCRLLLEKKKA